MGRGRRRLAAGELQALVVLVATIAIRGVYGLAKRESSGLGWIDMITVGALVLVTLAFWVASHKWPGRRAYTKVVFLL